MATVDTTGYAEAERKAAVKWLAGALGRWGGRGSKVYPTVQAVLSAVAAGAPVEVDVSGLSASSRAQVARLAETWAREVQPSQFKPVFTRLAADVEAA